MKRHNNETVMRVTHSPASGSMMCGSGAGGVCEMKGQTMRSLKLRIETAFLRAALFAVAHPYASAFVLCWICVLSEWLLGCPEVPVGETELEGTSARG